MTSSAQDVLGLTADASGSNPTMTPVIASPMAMENLPLFVAHTTGPLTFWGWPSTVTFVSPAAAAEVLVLEGVAELDDGPDALLPPEQPAAPATIVAEAMASNNSRFTKFSLGRGDLVKQYVSPRDYLLGKPAMNLCVSSQEGRRPDLRTSSKLGAAASRSDKLGAAPSTKGQSIASAGSVAQMVCSRRGLYSAEHKYITVELSCSARKP